MKSGSLSGILTSGVGRRIVGFFLLAGIAPVLVTALLAYLEVGRGLEQDVSRELRHYSKAYGTEVIERLARATQKADEIIRIISASPDERLDDYLYLTSDFIAVSSDAEVGGERQHFGNDRFLLGDASQVADELARYSEMPGIERLVLRVQWPGLEHAQAMANIERIGKLIA